MALLPVTLAQLNAMNEEDLRRLNSMVVGVIRDKSANKAWESARRFIIGQTVQFRDKQGRLRKMTIDRINTKSISGTETEANPITGRRGTWRVHPELLSAVAPATPAGEATFS